MKRENEKGKMFNAEKIGQPVSRNHLFQSIEVFQWEALHNMSNKYSILL